MNALEVPTPKLLEIITEDLKGKLTEPAFTAWVKTGAHRERAPQRADWWYLRTASVLYRVFVDGPVGTESLRTYYGGRKNRGVKPEKFRKASGKIIRTCLQALEKEKLIKKSKKGRTITSEGQKYLNSMAKKMPNEKKEIKQETKEHIEVKKENEKSMEHKHEMKSHESKEHLHKEPVKEHKENPQEKK
ncbi:MAG: 30S ribosomal protein S19e [Candidatus Diapherotrites archaeon]|nr:30S ribosomal protein S19e [Candidatus Diapherotrites archaeon]